MIDCICIACVWVRRLGLVHTAEQDGTTSSCPTYTCAQHSWQAMQRTNMCRGNATQRFPDQRPAQSMQHGRWCVRLLLSLLWRARDGRSDELTGRWTKTNSTKFCHAAKTWISGSCLRLPKPVSLLLFHFRLSQQKKNNWILYLAVANTDRRWDR